MNNTTECLAAMRDLGVFGIPVQDSVVLKERGSTLRISHSIRKVLQPDVCNNEMYQVDITLADS